LYENIDSFSPVPFHSGYLKRAEFLLKTDSGYPKDTGVSPIPVQSVLLPAKTYLGGGIVFLGLIHQISLHKHWHLKKNNVPIEFPVLVLEFLFPAYYGKQN